MPSPAVSVVVPLYNKRATIARTLDSVLAQDVADWELIVVDDGSTDGGPELVEEEYADPRIRVIRQANAGPGAARNRGAEQASGGLLTFLDADDQWEPGLLATAMRAFEAHPECGAFTAAYWLEPAGVDRWAELGVTEGVWRLAPDIARRELRTCAYIFHACTAVYRRECFERFGGFFTEDGCRLGEDVWLWIQLLLNAPVYRCVTPLGRYHMDASELGIGARKGALPIEPVLARPDRIRAVCPPDLRDVLELWLGQYAARAAFMQIDRGAPEKARALLQAFPRIRDWPSDHIRLRLRLAAPGLWSFARRLVGRS
jgi:glycosyltransferase involved in cell wall biosynthesis